MTRQDQRIAKFHAHLDICIQCRDHPFNLCPTGARLLKEATKGDNPFFRRVLTPHNH